MRLFKRRSDIEAINDDLEYNFDMDDPERDEVEPFDDAPMEEPPIHHEKRHGGYGVEEAIELMRTFPRDQDQSMVVSVVQKTLASANIDIDMIVRDAGHRIDRLGKQKANLENDVEELEKNIAEKRKEIASTIEHINETQNLVNSFKEVLSLSK